jgi:hypothetical protein
LRVRHELEPGRGISGWIGLRWDRRRIGQQLGIEHGSGVVKREFGVGVGVGREFGVGGELGEFGVGGELGRELGVGGKFRVEFQRRRR